MNWHTGNIAEAVAESKAKDAIFVVYIQGQDAMTANLDRILEDERVTSRLQSSAFVAVKIQGNSPTYAQFISLYKVVPVPSIFFIGRSGTPLDIATGIIGSAEELMVKINKVLLLAGKQLHLGELNQTTNTIADDASTHEGMARTIAGDDTESSECGARSSVLTVEASNGPTNIVPEETTRPQMQSKVPSETTTTVSELMPTETAAELAKDKEVDTPKSSLSEPAKEDAKTSSLSKEETVPSKDVKEPSTSLPIDKKSLLESVPAKEANKNLVPAKEPSKQAANEKESELEEMVKTAAVNSKPGEVDQEQTAKANDQSVPTANNEVLGLAKETANPAASSDLPNMTAADQKPAAAKEPIEAHEKLPKSVESSKEQPSSAAADKKLSKVSAGEATQAKAETVAATEPVKISSPEPADPAKPVVSTEPNVAALSAAAAAEKRAAAAAAAAAVAAAAAAAPALTAPAVMTASATTSSLGTLSNTKPQTSTSTPRTPAEEAELRMADIQKLIEQRKKERLEETKKHEKETELRRRREGREAQVQKGINREQELKNLQERIRRERQQEQATRERILAQIAADRAELANRAAMNTDIQNAPPTTISKSPEPSDSWVEETRLQIRLPGGITRTKTFPAAEMLSTVREYVREELLADSNIRDFTLATSYPRREFKTEDEIKTLNDLNLVPNAVLLVLKNERINSVVRGGHNVMNIVTSVIWAMLTPAAMAFDYINKNGFQRLRQRFMQIIASMGWGRPPVRPVPERDTVRPYRNDYFMLRTTSGPGSQPLTAHNVSGSSAQQVNPTELPNENANVSQPQELAQQRSGGRLKPRRYGESNIRRLADTAKDDDEDKATYNGNSTQQQ